MIKYFGKAFKITNDNLILATPFILFLLLMSIYLGVLHNSSKELGVLILLLITTLLMFSAFLAGWFFMFKKALELDKKGILLPEEKAKASFGLIKEFPVGIGEYFFSFVGGVILYGLLIAIFSYATYRMGLHFIGKMDLTIFQLKEALTSPSAMKAIVSSLSKDQLIKLNLWNFLSLGSMALFSFITMIWPAQIIFKTKNPLFAFFKSIGFIFRNFFTAIILFVYLSLVNFVVSLVNTISTINPILYFVSLLIYFYFVVYVIVVVFLYYDANSNEQKQEQDKYTCACGGNCGTDCYGQEQPCDKNGEGD